MPNPDPIFGRFGIIGPDVIASIKTAIFRGQSSFAFTPLGPTQVSGGLYGEFGLIGSEVISSLLQYPAVTISRAHTRQAILGPTVHGGVSDQTLLTLDWVQDAQPFVRFASSPPSLMTLDWVQDAQPFVTDDIDAIYSASMLMRFVVNTTSIPGGFSGLVTLAMRASSTLVSPNTEYGHASLSFQAFSTINPAVAASSNLLFKASVKMPVVVIEFITASLFFNANSTLHATYVVNAEDQFEFGATTSTFTPLIITIGDQKLFFEAHSSVPGLKRNVKPCEEPTLILNLSSNLPFGIWQTDPDALFSWSPVITCDKTTTGHSLVNGYYWRVDQLPSTEPTYTDHLTPISDAEVHLDNPSYGTGDWWFHVAAVNWTGIGPAAHYNVLYNTIPSAPAASGMFIDGSDSLFHDPLISYAPINPHVFTWTGSIDSDESSTLVYSLQIGSTRAFGVNSTTGLSEIVFEAESIPSASYALTQSLTPGQYYWRVNAFDGNESSSWSPVAQFMVNNPPNAPYDMSVSQTG